MHTKYESDHPEKSTAAMDAVEAAVVRMMAKEENNVPNIREIAQKSGYSVGTIYNYFKNMDSIFVYIFLRKQKYILKNLINVIASNQADKNRVASPHEVIRSLCYLKIWFVASAGVAGEAGWGCAAGHCRTSGAGG